MILNRKKLIGSLMFLMIFISTSSFAAPLEYSGGVQNEHIYEEISFLSGRPVKFKGSYDVSERERNDEKTVSYKFDLEAVGEEGSLTRTISYKTDLSSHEGTGQIIGNTEVTKYRETIRIGEDDYTLTDYQFSKSDVLDERAASNFYAGDIKGRKYYSYNGDQGNLILDISGGNVGYENFWGSTETQMLDYTVTAEIEGEEGDASWQGTYSNQVSDSLTKSLRYSENDANFSSFHGGHIKMINNSAVSKYDYSFPEGAGTISISQEMMPKIERLIVPKFRDVNGHWAEDNIKKLYSLDVFEDNSDIFSPNTPMDRISFAKAIMRASDIRATMEEEKPSRRRRNEAKEESYFKDIETNHPDYSYTKGAFDKNIMYGVSKDLFAPNKALTRAEAITVLVRALGFENRAPNPGFMTSFADDARIPSWAKDSIYIAKELNLLSGDPLNRVNAGQTLTRAEGSTLIIRFLEFLEKDLQKDYRENIVRF